MRLLAAALGAALLLTGCSNGGSHAATPPPSPSAAPSAAATADPYDALTPPSSPGVGSFNSVLATRAYAAVHGYLALQLLEKPTLLGGNGAELVSELQGALQNPSIVRDLGGAPTRRGLDYRPVFPKGSALSDPVAVVTASSYSADEVQGRAGERGLRVSWQGTLRYPVTLGGRLHQVDYSLKVAYVFSTVAQDPGGLDLQTVVRGSGSATGVTTACLAKGLLYPGPAAGACPA